MAFIPAFEIKPGEVNPPDWLIYLQCNYCRNFFQLAQSKNGKRFHKIDEVHTSHKGNSLKSFLFKALK
jgi:hypothetical protein